MISFTKPCVYDQRYKEVVWGRKNFRDVLLMKLGHISITKLPKGKT
jgi:hypothetical protein